MPWRYPADNLPVRDGNGYFRLQWSAEGRYPPLYRDVWFTPDRVPLPIEMTPLSTRRYLTR